MGDVRISYKLDYTPRTAERFILVFFFLGTLADPNMQAAGCSSPGGETPQKIGDPYFLYIAGGFEPSQNPIFPHVYTFFISYYGLMGRTIHICPPFSYRSPRTSRTDISDISLDKAGIPRRTC